MGCAGEWPCGGTPIFGAPPGLPDRFVNSAFTEGRAAIIINGVWGLSEYRTALGDRLGVAQLPNGPYAALPLPSTNYCSPFEAMISDVLAGYKSPAQAVEDACQQLNEANGK